MFKLLAVLFVTSAAGTTDPQDFLKNLLTTDLSSLFKSAGDVEAATDTIEGLSKMLVGYQLLNRYYSFDPTEYSALFDNVPGFGNYSPYVKKLRDSYQQHGEAHQDYYEAVKQIEESYCAEQVILDKQIEPALLTGPMFIVSMTTGSCSSYSDFNIEGDLGNLQEVLKYANLSCVGPEISYVSTPVTYTSKHIAPETYISSECKRYSVFGESYAKELYTMGDVVKFPDVQSFLASVSTGQYPLTNKFGNFSASGATYNLDFGKFYQFPINRQPLLQGAFQGLGGGLPLVSNWTSAYSPVLAKWWLNGRN
eukprot:TRINITY_DN13506_c0_g1_i7.p1 TRINITY_DN13506_c0_g1~~TRINITY_DN13506_c0_g1_i7.p1  ORF type:complete len:348 (+),score=62.77 TRINITY_DN13506_c0_g1_i7:120-1046(+)